jgi:16S rRNA (guanine966-N2)-methyltransferase
MRIISGIFRGKKLIQPSDNKTRPLKDLAKESIFNIIHHSNKLSIKIENSLILDLFSGVGSFGIECLSRGAKFVTFVENYKEVLVILNKNLKNLKLINNYEIIEKDILNNFEFNSFKKKFDIIFLDPPYKEKNIFEIINKIINQNILNKNGLIIIHRHKSEIDKLPEKLKVVEEKKYGISKILLFLF